MLKLNTEKIIYNLFKNVSVIFYIFKKIDKCNNFYAIQR